MKGTGLHTLAAIATLAHGALAQSLLSATDLNQAALMAGKEYSGEGLTITATPNGARVRCVMQKLEGEITCEGLWLTSSIAGAERDHFSVVGRALGREGKNHLAAIPDKGDVAVEGKLARFIRPRLIEEYTVGLAGVRQDFLITQRPPGTGELRVLLDVSGAKLVPTVAGAQLVLSGSGRKIAYHELRVTDATGKELNARMEILSMKHEAKGGTSSDADHRGQRLAIVVNDVGAVYPVRIDPVFNDANWSSMGGISGANGTVFAAAVDGQGNIYVGGAFTLIGNVIANHIAKWDGSRWSALGSGFNDTVGALAVSGSDVYAGGYFIKTGSNVVDYIAKWDGSKWSALGSGMDGGVYALAVSGTNLYAGGNFTKAGGTYAYRIAKWNGNNWSALGLGMNYSVDALAASGNNLYAGGDFSTAGSITARHVAKWDGTNWSALGAGMNSVVHALTVSGSNVYAAGYFNMAGGTNANYIAKWNGNSWSSLALGMNAPVYALAISGGDLYAGGDFTTAGGTNANYIAKWDGSHWSELGSGMGGPSVRALMVSDSKLYAGGFFVKAGGSVADGLAKWDGNNWTALVSGEGLNYQVYTLAVSGSALYAGGYFVTAGTNLVNHIAKWDGTNWSALGSGMNNVVRALGVSGTDVYAGGDFTVAGGNAANYVAKWDGNSWSALGSGVSDRVFALAVLGGHLYAGGDFTAAGGTNVNYIAKWDGSNWSALGLGMLGSDIYNPPAVYALAASTSELYAGGAFWTAGGSNVNYIAKWDGSIWWPLGSGMSGGDGFPYVLALAASGSNLFAGGRFTIAGGKAANCVAKWDGTTWTPLAGGVDGYVRALAISGSNLYAAGDFNMGTNTGGTAILASCIAKWDGSIWSVLASGVGSGSPFSLPALYALAPSGSELYAGGDFITAGGKASAYIARAYLPSLPTLSVLSSGTNVVVSWPSADTADFVLEQAGAMTSPSSWAESNGSITDDGTKKSVTFPATNYAAQFFRLRGP